MKKGSDFYKTEKRDKLRKGKSKIMRMKMEKGRFRIL